MEALISWISTGLLAALVVLSALGYRSLLRVIQSLAILPELKTAIETAARSNTEAASQASHSLNQSVVYPTQQLQKLFEKHETALNAEFTRLQNTNSTALNAIKAHIQSLQEITTGAIQQVSEATDRFSNKSTQVTERLQKIAAEYADIGTQISQKHFEVIQAEGQQLETGIATAVREFGRVIHKLEEKVQQKSTDIQADVLAVKKALVELRKSLDEAVKF